MAEELDDPVSQRLPVHENKQDQDEHESTDADELQVGPDGRLEALAERGLLDDPHVHRLSCPGTTGVSSDLATSPATF